MNNYFQLAAHNQEGQSNYSQIATYRTLPDRPDTPVKPRIKGHIQATQCRIVWGKKKINDSSVFIVIKNVQIHQEIMVALKFNNIILNQKNQKVKNIKKRIFRFH